MGDRIVFNTTSIKADSLILKSSWSRKIYTQYEQSRADIFMKVRDYSWDNNLGIFYSSNAKYIIDQKPFDLLFVDKNE